MSVAGVPATQHGEFPRISTISPKARKSSKRCSPALKTGSQGVGPPIELQSHRQRLRLGDPFVSLILHFFVLSSLNGNSDSQECGGYQGAIIRAFVMCFCKVDQLSVELFGPSRPFTSFEGVHGGAIEPPEEVDKLRWA